ncbi:unnamed protein product [Laminaria digitata]
MTTWAGFQTMWSGLPYVHAFSVETDRSRAGAAAEEAALLLRAVSGERLAMSPSGGGIGGSYGGYGGYGGGGGGDARIASAVACPGGNTDYAVSAAWAFEAWDGSPILCTLTAMKAPFSFLPPTVGRRDASRGGGGGGSGTGSASGAGRPAAAGGGHTSWHGRLEVRCGSRACADFAQSCSARLARFVTFGVFTPPQSSTSRQRQQQLQQHQQQQYDPFGGSFSAAAAAGGVLNGQHPDWFSRTDTSAPGSGGPGSSGRSSPSGGGVGGGGSGGGGATAAAGLGKVLPLVRAVWERRYVNTTRRAP